MPARLLVTGGTGFVAGSVIRQAGAAWETHALVRSAPSEGFGGVILHTVDLQDVSDLREAFLAARPDAVIHTAALANIDYCQSHPEEAEAVNVAATAGLADLCAETGARLVFCSTDTVFDGETGMYREDARPVPVNTYAETKVRAEEAVLSRLPSAAVARLSLVIGLPVLGAGNSFLAKLLPQIERGESVSAPADEIRTPVDVITLGRALLELAGNDFAGFIHLAGNDRMSRLEMVKRIAVRVGQSPDIVSAASGSATPGRAPRPRDVSLDNSLAQHTLSTPMQGIDGALDLIFDARKGIFP